jgi:Na+/proline symporter
VTLLYIGNFGLDQDTTQRLLACKDARSGSRGLYLSVWATLPVVAIFIAIGSLLYVLYNRPDLTGAPHALAATRSFKGADITIFMHFILTQTPPGLRGLATVGVLATAVGTTMSALNAMSSVLVEDFYRPWRASRAVASEAHYVMAGRIGMAATGLATLAMAVLSFYWQHYTNAPLLDFVLSVMNFAYAGLLGVYFVAVFTSRGSTFSVIAALVAGFVVILLLQPYIAATIGLPNPFRQLAFSWQLCLGTAVSFLVCLLGRSRARSSAAALSFPGV